MRKTTYYIFEQKKTNTSELSEESPVVINSLIITVVGMLVVFSFLILLVAIMKGFSALVLRFFPEAEVAAPAREIEDPSDGAKIAAAIAVAYDRRA